MNFGKVLGDQFNGGFMIQSVVNVLGVGVIYFILGSTAFAQNSSVELICRSKAKEVAAETYKGCVTELKQAQIEKIRTDYQSKLKELKDYYDGELRRVNGKSPQQNSQANGSISKSKAPQQSQSGVRKNPQTGARSMAKSLPPKTNGVIESSPASSPMIQQDHSSETAVIQNSETPVSIELRPSTGAKIPKGNPDFEDETTENPIAE